MSNLPPIDPQDAIGDEFLTNPNKILDPVIPAAAAAAVVDDNESWSSLYQRLLLQPSPAPPPPNVLQDSCQILTDVEGEKRLGMGEEVDAGNKRSKLKRRKSRSGNRRNNNGRNVDSSCGNKEKSSGEEENGGEVANKRKMDHNLRERVRRMKLNASYLALRALLPPPADQPRRRSKKRWSAPAIIERALNYIPELQNEVETLITQKHNLQASKCDKEYHESSPDGTDNSSSNNKENDGDDDSDGGDENRKAAAFCVKRIGSEEAIIQMTLMGDDVDEEEEGSMKKLIKVMESVESELRCAIKSASTMCVYSTDHHKNNTTIGICCHLHIVFLFQQGFVDPQKNGGALIEQVISRLQL